MTVDYYSTEFHYITKCMSTRPPSTCTVESITVSMAIFYPSLTLATMKSDFGPLREAMFNIPGCRKGKKHAFDKSHTVSCLHLPKASSKVKFSLKLASCTAPALTHVHIKMLTYFNTVCCILVLLLSAKRNWHHCDDSQMGFLFTAINDLKTRLVFVTLRNKYLYDYTVVAILHVFCFEQV